jgi:hypothetical protein
MDDDPPLITPLRKCTREGRHYRRDAAVEAQLLELAQLPRDELVERSCIRRRDDPNYVRSECLLYFLRACRKENSETHFERLYKLLLERVLRSLPNPDSPDGETSSLTKSIIRDQVLGRFTDLLAADRGTYQNKLDYFEVRFDGALASLRRDAQAAAWRHENRSATLEFDEETGEPSPEVERAAGSFDPFAPPEGIDDDYRSRFDAAIDALPVEQIRIIEMLRQGIPIDSKDPEAITIAKVLGKSEKTIRTYRDKAFAALREALTGEDR